MTRATRNHAILRPGWHPGNIVIGCCAKFTVRCAERLAASRGGQSNAWRNLDTWIVRPVESIGRGGILLGAAKELSPSLAIIAVIAGFLLA